MKNYNYGLNTQNFPVSCNLTAVYDAVTIPGETISHNANEPLLFCAVYTLSGRGRLPLSNGTDMTLGANTLFFGKYSEIQAFACDEEEWHYHCYWFTVNGFELTLNLPVIKQYDGDSEFIAEIIHDLKINSPYSVMRANSMMIQRLIKWKGYYKEYENKHEPKLFAEIKKYINLNIEKNLKLDELASTFNYCQKHIRNIFKKYSGLGPKEYINNVKLEKAANLLVATSWSINEISSMLNFSSPYHFGASFKKRFLITPAKYRKSSQNR